MTIQVEEVWPTPKGKAINTYKFILADYQEGINYGVSIDLYNECMEAIGSSMKATQKINAEGFVKDFHAEYTRLREEHDEQN